MKIPNHSFEIIVKQRFDGFRRYTAVFDKDCSSFCPRGAEGHSASKSTLESFADFRSLHVSLPLLLCFLGPDVACDVFFRPDCITCTGTLTCSVRQASGRQAGTSRECLRHSSSANRSSIEIFRSFARSNRCPSKSGGKFGHWIVGIIRGMSFVRVRREAGRSLPDRWIAGICPRGRGRPPSVFIRGNGVPQKIGESRVTAHMPGGGNRIDPCGHVNRNRNIDSLNVRNCHGHTFSEYTDFTRGGYTCRVPCAETSAKRSKESSLLRIALEDGVHHAGSFFF